MLCGIAAALPARAQQWPRESTPATVPLYQMARPGYSPAGMEIDGFLLFPTVSETAAYDDNIFASDRNVAGDYVNTTAEQLSVASQWSRHSLSGRLFTAQQVFLDHSAENTNTYGAEASGRLDVTGESFLQLDGGFEQQPQQRASLEASTGNGVRPIYNTSYGTLSYIHRLDRWVERAQAAVQDVAYVTSGNASRDRVSQTYSDRVSYDLSDEFALFVQGAYQRRDWGVRPAERNFDILSGLGGVTVAIPTVIEAELGIGVLRQAYSNDAFQTLVAPTVSGTLTWNVLPLTSILAAVEHTVTGTETFCDVRAGVCQNSAGANQAIPAGAGQRNSLETTVAQIGAEHEIWHDFLGAVRFRYERDAFDLNNLVDDTYEMNTNARYLINRYLEADLDFTHRERNANLPNDRTFNSGPYSENIISINLKAGL